MAIIFHGEQSRTIGSSAPMTIEHDEMFARVEDGTLAYLNTFESPMIAQRVANALRQQQRFNGKSMKRCQWVHENFWQIERVDHDKQRVYMKSGSFFLFKDLTKTVVDYIEWLMSCK